MANYKYTTELKIGLSSQEKTDIANAIEDKVVARVGSQPVAFLTLQEIESLDRNIGLVVKKELKPEPNPNGEYTTENIYRWNDESASYEDTGIIYSRTLLDKDDPILLDIRNDFTEADRRLERDIIDNRNRINEVDTHQDLQDKRLDSHNDRLIQVENELHETIVTEVEDDFTGNRIDVPTSVEIDGRNFGVIDNQLFKTSKIKGKTRSSINKLPFPYANGSREEYGIKWVVNADGTIDVETPKGPAEQKTYFVLYKDETKPIVFNEDAFLSGIPSENVDDIYFQFASGIYEDGKGKVIPAGTKTTEIFIAVNANATISKKKIKPMINLGTKKQEYVKYFEGLQNTTIDTISSVGINRLPFPYVNDSKEEFGVKWVVNKDGSITVETPNGPASRKAYFVLYKDEQGIQFSQDAFISGIEQGNVQDLYFQFASGIYDSGNGAIIPKGAKGTEIFIAVQSGATISKTTIYPMINVGKSKKKFELYKKEYAKSFKNDNLELKGAGVASDEAIIQKSDNNDLLEIQVTKKMGEIDLGKDFDWSKSTDYGFYSKQDLTTALSVNEYDVANIACAKYNKVVSFISIYRKEAPDLSIALYNKGIIIKDLDALNKTEEEFKNSLLGVKLVYELEIPIKGQTISNITIGDISIKGVKGGEIQINPIEPNIVEPKEISFKFDCKYWEQPKGGNL